MQNETNTKNMKATTETKIIGQGTYDNGQYADSYNKTLHYEVKVSNHYGRTYVAYTEIFDNHVRGSVTQSPIESVTNKDVLKVAENLMNN